MSPRLWKAGPSCVGTAAVALSMTIAVASAGVDPGQATALGARLTPFGAEVAGNADGSIPAWTGGLTAPPPCFAGSQGRYCDPFADDRPLYTVTAANVEAYAALLSPGQRALFAHFPDSYRMRVFPTRRSFSNPPAVYAATIANAPRAALVDGRLSNAATGLPFPMPASGAEALWNHRLRWRPLLTERVSAQFAVGAGGDFSQAQQRERVRFPYGQPGYELRAASGLLSQRMQWLEQPARLAGTGILLGDTADPASFARRAWQFGGGDQKARSAPNLGYETIGLGSDDLRTNDQIDMFFGPLDRYDLKLVGKQELLVAANSYALHAASVPYRQLVGKHHLDPDLVRYERRRVWVVDALVRRGGVHIYRHRRFYLDEDGWQIRVVDNYDAQDQLWRVQEAHTVIAYDRQFELPVAETVYDLASGHYLVQGLNNEAPEVAYPQTDAGEFGPGDLAWRGRSLQRAAPP